MAEYNFVKTPLHLDALVAQIRSSSISTTLSYCSALGSDLTVVFPTALSSEDEATLSSIVAAHTGMTTVQSLTIYLDNTIFPFIKTLINTFAAENISMGITQAGKTGDVLGLFEKQYTIAGVSRPVSLKASFDTGSLYVSRAIIQHVRDNPTEYDGLSPFVTDARLLGMKNKIEAQLGLPLST